MDKIFIFNHKNTVRFEKHTIAFFDVPKESKDLEIYYLI